MLVRDFECRSYGQAIKLLGGRDSRAVCNNTVLREGESGRFVAVELYGHEIVALWSDGVAILSSFGHRTNTTKDRINRCLPGGWRVSSVKGGWRLSNRWQELSGMPFVDGMTVPGTDTGGER